jgi:hypothetical protein
MLGGDMQLSSFPEAPMSRGASGQTSHSPAVSRLMTCLRGAGEGYRMRTPRRVLSYGLLTGIVAIGAWWSVSRGVSHIITVPSSSDAAIIACRKT